MAKQQKTERVYVKVVSEFDSTGYMLPTSITWADGRTFPIEKVRDFRPAGTADNGFSGDCFTVLIQGQEKHLFFEHIAPFSPSTSADGLWRGRCSKLSFLRKEAFHTVQHTYLAIDLKSYYASAECASRHLDPLTTNLVVADASRTEKTICLAFSPSLKACGIPGRARLFEVVQKVKEVNAERLRNAIRNHTAVYKDGNPSLSSKSYDAVALAKDPSLEVDYLVAPPRMLYYEKVSRQIYSIYQKYIAPEDILVYSIDEVFIDATAYLPHYQMSAHDLAMTMIREVLYTTGITATAGIGTNLYLAKLAMDITAKHAAPDKDGVRIAELNEESFRYLLWDHKPLTDFWQTGPGTVRRLKSLGIHTMGELARFSLTRQDMLYDRFGVDAEILIDHAWGLEPCTMQEIKAYRPSSTSISEGQVLKEPWRESSSRRWRKTYQTSFLARNCPLMGLC